MLAKKKFVADRLADEIYTVWAEEWLNAKNLPLPRGFKPDVFYQPFAKECLTSCDWIGTGRGQIDELKETQAAILRVNSGFSTREIEVAKFGGDWRRIFRQLEREQRLADELGLELSRNATKDQTGSGQTVMGGTGSDTQDQQDQAA